MQQGDRRAGAVERAVIDLVEALILSGREGERFAALVVDDDMIQLTDPAVRARVEGGCPEPGTRVRARLRTADAATRTVGFEVEAGEA
jgi:plasmid replication initiation protein